jgi:multidrug efflux pump subunit AcrA (membrane-fusion protein)
MKPFLFLLLSPFAALAQIANPPVILDETGVKNLRIETVSVEETTFEETVFALGRIRVAPGHRAVVSSRISGRAMEVNAHIDTLVKKGETALTVESRQPGDPPPVIKLPAPIDGLVSVVNIAPGQPVEPDASLIEILDLTLVHAVAAVPEHLAGTLKLGQQAHIRVAGAGTREYLATLVHFGTQADSETGTVEAAFHVENPGLLLRPGMRAEFSIITGKREGVINVPRAALQGEASNRFVYVKHFDLPNAFLKTPVQVGAMNDRFVEIVGGLFAADEVVTRGAYSLSFAGGGSGISLKEALDAAHGHEHAEDGSELTPEKRAELEAKKKGMTPGAPAEAPSPVWKYVSGVLLVLLLASLFGKSRRRSLDEEASSSSNPERH